MINNHTDERGRLPREIPRICAGYMETINNNKREVNK